MHEIDFIDFFTNTTSKPHTIFSLKFAGKSLSHMREYQTGYPYLFIIRSILQRENAIACRFHAIERYSRPHWRRTRSIQQIMLILHRNSEEYIHRKHALQKSGAEAVAGGDAPACAACREKEGMRYKYDLSLLILPFGLVSPAGSIQVPLGNISSVLPVDNC